MRHPKRLDRVAAIVLALAGTTCSFPTDKSDGVFVTLSLSDSLISRGVLGQGQVESAFARAWRRVGASDSAEILNVDFVWSSDNPGIVLVEDRGAGEARVTGVGVGTEAIRVKAAAFEQSLDAAALVRVAQNFIIDSIRPLTMGFGGKLTVYGVRISQVLALDLGFGTLIPDQFSFSGNLEGLGSTEYWVPYPASSGRPFYFALGGIGVLTDSVTVVEQDIYEPNYALPTPVDVNGPGGPRSFLGFPTVFFNPALYYEPYDPVTGGPFAIDWYRFAQTDTSQALSIILSTQVFDDTAFQYFSDSLFFTGTNYSAPGWLSSPGNRFYICDGMGFSPSRETRTPTTIMALRSLPGKAVHLFSNYGKDGGYNVTVVRGYFTQDRRIGPDKFEENDNWCRYADQNFNTSTDSSISGKHIVVGLFRPWRDSTLTIDNAHDMDWYRFRVQAPVVPADTMVTIRTRSLPFLGLDFSDIDIYVRRASDFASMGSATAVGSNETLSLMLPADDYYLGVVDAASSPTRYSMCIVHGGAGVNCTPPILPTAPASATLAPSVYRIPRQAPRDFTQPPRGLPIVPR